MQRISMATNAIQIDDKLLNLMRKGVKVIIFDDKEYRALGSGGEGNVYSFDEDSNLAIKVFREYSICYKNPSVIEKEIYLVRFLKDLDQINDHVVDMYDSEPCLSGRGYYFMELYDGDLQTWVQNATTRGSDLDEASWLSMIFQITFAFKYLNSVGVLHGDPKPKNIFYTSHNLRDPNTDGKRAYLIDGKAFEIPYTTRFVLGDFSKSRIAEMDRDIEKRWDGESGTPDLYYNLTHATDLYEISRLIYRVLVNSVTKIYSKEKIKNLVESILSIDSEFAKKVKEGLDGIHNMKLGGSIKDNMTTRLYAYELVEAGHLTIDRIQELDSNLVLPSKKILDLLERVSDPNETMETLFGDYLL